jgi:hypothetical protein
MHFARFFILSALLLAVAATMSHAQMTTTGAGNSGGAAMPSGPPCNAGQLDFSDGCNTTQYLVILR